MIIPTSKRAASRNIDQTIFVACFAASRTFVRNSYEFLEGCDIRIVRNSSFEFPVTNEIEATMTHEIKIGLLSLFSFLTYYII